MARPTTRFYLVRHGETAANVEMRYLGARDDPLSERGRDQALRLAEALAVRPVAAVFTSPLERARATADPIAARLGLAARVDQRLREAAFGTWDGLTRAEVLALGPMDRRLLEAWERDPEVAPPGGEALVEVQRRVVELLGALAQAAAREIVIVSHVSPIKAALAAALGAPLLAARRLFLDPATISVVDWGDTPVVRLFNAHGHLGWASARWMAGPPG